MIALDTVAPQMGGMAGSGMAGGMGGAMVLFPLLALLAVATLLTAGVVGFGALARDADGSAASEPDETPVERLQRRYAEGELTEAEFERALERELEREKTGGTGSSPTRETQAGGEASRAR
ncbi:SHOCT domain-containing protein [Halorubrum sp. Atlit-8R]|uniref:SHOCT domain-containing protein n=1 Tax=unclassified Halorubrum TaxID=2642239 RepID=UPI000EF1F35A|nr:MULTISPECIES: SHOCT domain-containing protein [unclassified Halorubrum]RLM70580.1 SHOCT domain-containing protein [Halorubrum sp. Atlit-9R]RLM83265.1 SHOCT domain-containing protein [Halorubrum sp. Atlit-8R]